MTAKEELHLLVDEVPPERLGDARRLMHELVAPRRPSAGLSREERWRRMLPLIEKREAGEELTADERRELIALGRGMSAHLPGSVDDFLREKHEDTEREEARMAGEYRERAA